MARIRHFLCQNNKKSPVRVPHVIRDMVSRRVLVMEYIDGIPILKLGDEMAKRGIRDGKLVLAIADNDPLRASESYRDLGIETLSKCQDEQNELLRLAQTMFDTKLPPGVTMLQPFSEESSIKKIAVKAFPEELFSVLRTVHILRGLSVGLGINFSCAEQWRPIAEEILYAAGRLS
ncbi:putative lysine-specific demethylase REF6-like, partial [Capsicum annuum]